MKKIFKSNKNIMETTLKYFLIIIKYLFTLYLIASYKSIPFAYFFRFYYNIFKNIIVPIFTGKKTSNISRLQNEKYAVFFHNELTTYCSPFECDFYFHKSNSTYFSELDIARGDLMTKIFQKLFVESKKWPYIPVANVFTNFLKEIKPFQSYTIQSSILCWDEKWIYVMSKFLINNNKVIASLSITKYVVKDNRKTIPPIYAMKFCGIYNDVVENISQRNLKILSEECGFDKTERLENLVHKFEKL